MISIIRVNKQGNKILSYTCSDGSKTKDLSKKQVCELIDKKRISNATKQIYKGTTIIRIKDNVQTSQVKAEKVSTAHQSTKPNTEDRQDKVAKISAIMGNAKKAELNDTEYVMVSEINGTKIIYIPDCVEGTIKSFKNNKVWKRIVINHTGKLKIVGGKNIVDASDMFRECKAQSIDLSSFDTRNVTAMKGMFLGCRAQSLDLSSFDTSKVTSMHGMFCECQAQSLDLSSFDTSKVTDMCCMLDECQALSLDLSSFNTSKVINMSGMFCACKVPSLDLSSFDTSNVKDMEYMFMSCQASQIITSDKQLISIIKRKHPGVKIVQSK